MKIENMRQGDVLPKFGNAFQVKAWKGRLYVAKWPRPRGKNVDHLTSVRNKWFKLVNELSKFASPGQQRAAMKLAPHGALYPRDYLVSAMAGRMYTIQLDTGETLYPMSLKNEISKDLDVIGKTRGSVLYRGQQLWDELIPPAGGGVLWVPGEGQDPQWEKAGPNIGGHCMTFIPTNVEVTSASATMSWLGTLTKNVKVDAAFPKWRSVVNGDYKVTITEMSGTTIGTVVATSNTRNFSDTNVHRVPFDFTDPPTLVAGTKYGFHFTRTNALATSSAQLFNSITEAMLGFPVANDLGFARYNSTDPVPTQTPANSGLLFPFSIDLMYRF